MSRRAASERAAWRVAIPAHSIARTGLGGAATGQTYDLPERVTVRFETSQEAAVEFAVRELHVAFGVPPWGPYFRESERLARVERCYAVAAAGRA